KHSSPSLRVLSMMALCLAQLARPSVHYWIRAGRLCISSFPTPMRRPVRAPWTSSSKPHPTEALPSAGPLRSVRPFVIPVSQSPPHLLVLGRFRAHVARRRSTFRCSTSARLFGSQSRPIGSDNRGFLAYANLLARTLGSARRHVRIESY